MTREEIIHTFGAKKILEVGVLRGRFAGHLLKTNPEELHLLDPWRVFSDTLKEYKAKSQEDWDKTYQSVANKFGKDDRVTIHRGTTEEMASKLPDNYFDLIYIDGNHSYEYVALDIKLLLPKVKKGGIIGGHDIDIGHRGVKRAVEEVFGKYEETTEYDKNTKGVKFAKSWFVRL